MTSTRVRRRPATGAPVSARTVSPAQATIAHSAPALGGREADALAAQFASGWLAQGAATSRFAAALASHTGAATVRLTASGTSGLALALRALGVGAGDEVVVPTYICASVLEAVAHVGATPRLADVGDDWLLDAAGVRRVMTRRTRAVVAASVFGLALDLEALAGCGLPVIDDRCQAFGLARPSPPSVAYSVCSFHATKCLTTGEGGAVLAWQDEAATRLAEAAAVTRRTLGVFSDLQAALGLAQLASWPARQARRDALAARYLAALPAARTAHLRRAAARGSVWFRFPVTLTAGEAFEERQRAFAARGIAVRRGVDALLHRAAGLPDHDFPGATHAFARTLSLPLWPAMTDDDAERVLAACADVLG